MATQSLEKVTLRLFAGDKERIDELFPTMGHNKAIRLIVRKFIKEQQEARNKAAGKVEVEAEELL